MTTRVPSSMIQSTASSYAPVWSTSGASIGNGSLTGSYTRVGNIVTATINLTAGSTTNFGSGMFVFSLPFTSSASAVGSIWIQDTGTGFRAGSCLTTGNLLTCYIDNQVDGVKSTIPMTWTSVDILVISVTFQVAG